MPYYRMERTLPGDFEEIDPDIQIIPYIAEEHHDILPRLYASAYGESKWKKDWDDFDEFEPSLVLLSYFSGTDEYAGFLLAYTKGMVGYISVLAVDPEHQKQGVAKSLIATILQEFSKRDLSTCQVDADCENRTGITLYQTMGFQTIAEIE